MQSISQKYLSWLYLLVICSKMYSLICQYSSWRHNFRSWWNGRKYKSTEYIKNGTWLFHEMKGCQIVSYPANISTSDQRCFNIVDKRWNNVDLTLKRKQNPTSDFQRCTTLIQRQCPRWNNVTQRRNNVAQRWYNVDTTLFQPSVDVS